MTKIGSSWLIYRLDGQNDEHVRQDDQYDIHVIHWDHEISIIVTSILTVLTVFRRKLNSSSLLIMEIMASHVIHSWKSQCISVWFLVMIYRVIC
jgi:hypothetical protein